MNYDKFHCYLVTLAIIYYINWCETTSSNYRIIYSLYLFYV